MGSYTSPATMAAVVVVTVVPVTLLIHISGFRRKTAMSLPTVLREATVAVAVATEAVLRRRRWLGIGR